MSQNKIAAQFTEYEKLMNQAADHYKNDEFDCHYEIKWAFIRRVEKYSKCYSRNAIQRDAVHCLGFAKKGLTWRDLKGRIKHNPDDLMAERKVNIQPKKYDVVQGVLDAISHSTPLTSKKHKKSRKVIGR